MRVRVRVRVWCLPAAPPPLREHVGELPPQLPEGRAARRVQRGAGEVECVRGDPHHRLLVPHRLLVR